MSESEGSLVWQTRLSRAAAKEFEADLETLGLDRSQALRRGLRLLHQEATEIRMAQEYAEFYPGGKAPLSPLTAALYPDADVEPAAS